jgi:hypothetical protein
MARYLTLQNLSDTSVVDGDLVGQIGFAASNDSDGGDAIAICSTISVKAEGTFDGSNNPGAIVFATAPNGGPTDRLKVTNEGHFVPIADTSYDLGSSSFGFRSLYVSGIDFNGLGTQTLPFNDFNVAANTDAVTVVDGNTITFTGLGNVSVDRSGQTIRISGAGGGGGSPGGSVNQIQINDGAGGFTAATDSDRLVYDPATNILDLGRQSTDDTTGTQVTNYFYTNNFAIGGDNFISSSFDNSSDTNTAIGIEAMSGITTFADNNTAIGYQALSKLTTNSSNNTAIGYRAGNGSLASSDNQNTFIGSQAGQSCQQANNVYVGYNAGQGNTNGFNNTIIGSLAADANSTSWSNITAIGTNALGVHASAGNNHIAIGEGCMDTFNSTDSYNVVIGTDAWGKSDGSNNTVIGSLACQTSSPTDCDNNVIVGYGTRVDGDSNIILGYQACGNNGGGTIGHNVVIGYQAAQSNDTSNVGYNVIIGDQACQNGDDKGRNVVIGGQAAKSSTAYESIIIGYDAITTTALSTTGNIILNVNAVHGLGGLAATDDQRLLIGGTLGGNLSSKRIKIGGSNVVDVDTAVLEVECNLNTEVGLLVQGAASQSANLTEWQDSTQAVLASIEPSGKLYYQSSYSPITDEGTASSFTFNLDESNVFSGTLNGATTITTINGDVGQRFLVRLKQDNTGSRTVSSWFGGRVSWPGGSAPTLSSSANLVDLFGFLVTSGTAPTLYYDGFTIATGIQ